MSLRRTDQKYWKDHIEAFGVEPQMIGLIRDPIDLAEAITKAVEAGIPYDEYKSLPEYQKKKYNSGLLIL